MLLAKVYNSGEGFGEIAVITREKRYFFFKLLKKII